MNIVALTFLSFLPKRYREYFTPFEISPVAGVLSGAVESLLSLYLLIRGYHAYVDQRMASMPEAVLANAGQQGGESAIMGLGSIFMMEYLIHVTTILLLFFALEGVVRIIAATASREVVPVLPLKIAEVLQSQWESGSQERRLGPRIRDEVSSPSPDTLQIASCRPKPWTELTTISHEGVLFELEAQAKGPASRPFLYVLRRKPATAVIRGICAYDPDETLQDPRS